MAEHTDPNEHHDDGHHDVNYTKIYVALLVLLVISILGPEIGITWVTLVTAFGIALVKATMVINNFMHLKWEKAIMKWMLATSLVIVALFFFGVSPDVLKHEGLRWQNVAAMAAVERGIESEDHGAEGEGEEHAEEEVAGEAVAPAPAPAEFSPSQAYASTCATCHGPQGAGDGPGAAALDPKPASFNDPAFWAETSDERMANVIKNGGAAAGLSAAMPAWGSLYSDQQIQELVEYLKTFRP